MKKSRPVKREPSELAVLLRIDSSKGRSLRGEVGLE